MPGTMVPRIWIVDWYLNGGLNTSPLTKWWSEYRTTKIQYIWITNHLMMEQISMIWIPKPVGYSDSHCSWIDRKGFSKKTRIDLSKSFSVSHACAHTNKLSQFFVNKWNSALHYYSLQKKNFPYFIPYFPSMFKASLLWNICQYSKNVYEIGNCFLVLQTPIWVFQASKRGA